MERRWTILVYMSGDNNLEQYGQRDLYEMKQVGSNAAVQVVVQFDRMSDALTRRYMLTRDQPLETDVVQVLPETNTGDPDTLQSFVEWGLATYPAEYTALILWNHGTGWKDDDIYALPEAESLVQAEFPRSLVRSKVRLQFNRSLFRTSSQIALRDPALRRAILFDDSARDFLDNVELKKALDGILLKRSGRKLDLIGFDACLMSMIEVACQIEHACHYMVGSQEIEPGDGWPYSDILAALVAEPSMTADQFSRVIVSAYLNFYRTRPTSVPLTQAAVRLQYIPKLVEVVGLIADQLIENLAAPGFQSRTLMPVLRSVHKFRDQQYVDLLDLARLLAAQTTSGVLRELAQDIVARLDPEIAQAVVLTAGSIAPQSTAATPTSLSRDLVLSPPESWQQYSTGGLSIYLTTLQSSPAYEQLIFAQRCSWGRFLQRFVAS